MRPMVAIIVAAVVASAPGIVSRRRMSPEASTCPAIAPSMTASSSLRKSIWRRQPSRVWRSSAGSSSVAIHWRPALPNRSLTSGRAIRLRTRTADLVLGPRALADELGPARGEPPQRARGLTRDPHLREQIRGQQLGQGAGIDAVVLDLGVADRPDLHRAGEHDVGDVAAQDAGDGQRVTGEFQHDAIIGGQARREQLQRLAPHATTYSPAVLHLREPP